MKYIFLFLFFIFIFIFIFYFYFCFHFFIGVLYINPDKRHFYTVMNTTLLPRRAVCEQHGYSDPILGDAKDVGDVCEILTKHFGGGECPKWIVKKKKKKRCGPHL